MIKGNGKYSLLEFQGRKDIPYLAGTRIRADHIYCVEYKAEKRSISDIARGRDLSIKAVKQAIEWCIFNDNLITRVLAKENEECDRALTRIR